jgi:hypothetical protein
VTFDRELVADVAAALIARVDGAGRARNSRGG